MIIPFEKRPRFKKKFKTLLNKEFLEVFIKEHPKYKNLDLKTLKLIIKTFNETIIDGVGDNRQGVELPLGLGHIFIGSCKPTKKKTNIDFKLYKTTGIKAHHQNFDTDGKLMKVFYTNYSCNSPFANKILWGFELSQYNKRKLSKVYVKNYTRYVDILPKEKASTMAFRKEAFERNCKAKITEDYNEFKL